MTTASPTLRRVREFTTEIASYRVVLWAAFIVVHRLLGLINLYSPTNPMGDVRDVYRHWMEQGVSVGYWAGIDAVWVYPIMALAPMVLAYAFGSALYASTWLSLVLVLDAAALATLTGWGRQGRNLAAGWWWVGFIAVLGPISLGRIDSISVPLAMMGMLLIASHPIAASVVVTVAAWIKVWPVALVAAMVIAVRTRGSIVASAIATSLGIVLVAVVFGSGANVFSFVTEQTGRGLQIEAPISTPWLWQALAHVNGAAIYYDSDILTFQVTGGYVDATSALMTPVMLIAAGIVAALGARAVSRRAAAETLLPLLALAFVTALIVFNKVGSPQYISWFAVPIVLALASGRATRASFRTPAVVIVIIAALTQVIYPYFYDSLIYLNPALIVIITVRNALLVVLYGWCVRALWLSRGEVALAAPDLLPATTPRSVLT